MSIHPEDESHFLETSESIQLHCFVVPDTISPLTIIKGHAQLIRRRSAELSEVDRIRLERSIAAIERAVERIAASLDDPGRELPTRGA